MWHDRDAEMAADGGDGFHLSGARRVRPAVAPAACSSSGTGIGAAAGNSGEAYPAPDHSAGGDAGLAARRPGAHRDRSADRDRAARSRGAARRDGAAGI
jgi:hypothetical protein